MIAYGVTLARIGDLASRFDAVHSHIDWVHVPLLRIWTHGSYPS